MESDDPDVITNDSFLKVYDNFKFSLINQARNTKKLHWDQTVQIFKQLNVDLCDVPTDKVSQTKCQAIDFYVSKIYVST